LSTTCECGYHSHIKKPDRLNDWLDDVQAIAAVCGGKSDGWVHRHIASPDCCFPEVVYLGRRPHVWHSDLIAWIDSPHTRVAPKDQPVFVRSDAGIEAKPPKYAPRTGKRGRLPGSRVFIDERGINRVVRPEELVDA